MSWSLSHYLGNIDIADHGKPTCVVLSGWGVRTDIFDTVLPGLCSYFNIYLANIEHYIDFEDIAHMARDLACLISEEIKTPYWLMGWSMGGNIALELANCYPSSVSGALLIAVNPSFISREYWPKGIKASELEKLCYLLEEDAAQAIKKFDRLQSLGDKQQRKLLNALSEYREVSKPFSICDLKHGLMLLGQITQYDKLENLNIPILWLLGENDRLVNAHIKDDIQALNRKAHVNIINNASHLPFLSQAECFFDITKQFLDREFYRQEKLRVATRFSKAAKTYDDYSELQKIVGNNLLKKASYKQYAVLLDAGCGTGYWSDRLNDFSERVIGIDLAEGMLAYSRQHHKEVSSWLKGDIEYLPFANNAIDAIYSNLAVQWSHQFDALLNEWYRVLSYGSDVFISTLGPQTLYELETSFSKIDSYQHVNRFLSEEKIHHLVAQTSFEIISIEKKVEIIKYAEPIELMRDLKGIGASLVQNGGVKGLMGKKKLNLLTSAYEDFRLDDGTVPATYEVIYLHLKK